jgi:hypothetical protein
MEPTWGKAEGEDTKLVEAASPAEAKELPVLHMDVDVEVGVPQVYGCRPVPSANGMAYILRRLHAEMGSVQVLKVDDRMHTPFFFWTRKMLLMKLGGGGSKETSSMAPFSSRAVTSASMKELFAPCEGVEKAAPWQESGGGDMKGGR